MSNKTNKILIIIIIINLLATAFFTYFYFSDDKNDLINHVKENKNTLYI
ncbi:hypothetical protein MBCUR_18670 [Methanobrevibacter curvatus]|uniref:Uncharacterized protein n=1 Tax=Methanobrevibacter curvatus TaxID=49547 RepID=A0A162FI10_9EURY|nr:hypothetical protein MBCUR_18670 [Methanobrevibacter curvatus]